MTSVFEDDQIHPNSIILSPNPANDFIEITFNTDYSEQQNVSIYSLSGQRVFDLKMRTGSRVDVSYIDSGLYLIWVSDGINVSTQKLIVK